MRDCGTALEVLAAQQATPASRAVVAAYANTDMVVTEETQVLCTRALSLVGAGSVVTEGKEFPDNSLIIGAPAKVVRTLDDAAVAKLKQSAEHYVDNGRRFAKGLKKIG